MESTERIRINVSGVVFVCFKSTLKMFEDSLLAKLDESAGNFDPVTREFFFDRNSQLFHYILDAYRKGTIHLPKDTCGVDFKAELEFWGLGTKYVSPCCWGALYTAEEDMKTVATLEDFYCGCTGLSLMTGTTPSLRNRIWLFLYEPKSSKYATIWALFISIVIVASVLATAVESLPEVYTDRNTVEETRSFVRIQSLLGWQNYTSIKGLLYAKINPAIPAIDCVCFAILTLEMVVGAIVCPRIVSLIRNNWIHVIEIVVTTSFWISFALEVNIGKIESTDVLWLYIILKYVTALKFVRLFRVGANVPALRIMGLSLVESKQGLCSMVLILFIFSFFFGMLIFIFEWSLPEREFENVFTAMYWAIITLTTVGYGDYTPTSVEGHVIACTCAVCGMIMLAIPIGIISSEFQSLYSHHKYAKKYLKENSLCRKDRRQKKLKDNDSRQKQPLFDYKKT